MTTDTKMKTGAELEIEEIEDDLSNNPSPSPSPSTSYSLENFPGFEGSASFANEASVNSALKSRLAFESYLAIALMAIGAVVGTFIFPAVGTAVGAGLGLALASVIIGAESLVIPSRPSQGEKASYLRPLIGAILFVGGAVALMGLLSWVALPAVGIAVSLDTSISLAFMSLPFLMLCGIWNQYRKQPTQQETDLTIGIEAQKSPISNTGSPIADSITTNPRREPPESPEPPEPYQGPIKLNFGSGSRTPKSTQSGEQHPESIISQRP